jgi:hypothetical protein
MIIACSRVIGQPTAATYSSEHFTLLSDDQFRRNTPRLLRADTMVYGEKGIGIGKDLR